MHRRIIFSVIFLVLSLHWSTVLADESLSGYASIVAGRTTNGNEFLADYPKAGIYDDNWSFSPDTSIGVQFNTKVNDKLEFVIQAISNGALDYDVMCYNTATDRANF